MTAQIGEPLLQIDQLHKSFTLPVLQGVHLAVNAGEVCALMGANGAGKSTLSNIICGRLQPTSGDMQLAGKPYAPKSLADAERLGVRMVLQELAPINNLSVGENLCLRDLPSRFGFVQYRQVEQYARQALALVGLQDLDPATPMHRLGIGQKQLVEIATVIARPCRLLILDEPTAALTDPQIEVLFQQIKKLQSRGVAVIYISHRQSDIETIADKVTVLRDGKTVFSQCQQFTTGDDIISHMTGVPVTKQAPFAVRPVGDLFLSLRGITRPPLLNDINLAIHRGEVLGLAGLIGSGRTELLRAIMAADPVPESSAGIMTLAEDNKPYAPRSPVDAVAAGIGMIPEDRQHQALLSALPGSHNITLGQLSDVASFGWIKHHKENQLVRNYQQQLSVQWADPNQPVSQLSGGNQQKIIIARWLLRDCELLLFDEPTRGIDVQTKRLIYTLLDQLAKAGKAIVVVASEWQELTTVCDRIAVLSQGEISGVFNRGQWSERKLMAAACANFLATTDAETTSNHDAIE